MFNKTTALLWLAILILISGLGFLVAQGLSLTQGTVTFKGIPVALFIQAVTDGAARDAYLTRDQQRLHDRLEQLGIEEEIKAFYRPQIPDETKLDQHIHQLFYSATGYIGKNYTLNTAGSLVPKTNPDAQFQRWFKLALAAGVVAEKRQENNIWYVISPQGTVAPYESIAAIFPESTLKQLIIIRKP